MAIYHLNVKNISRGDGRSVVAAAAYRAGEVLPNDAEEKLSDFGGRRDVITSGIRLPAGAPDWMADRTTLWNAVELAEKRHDARLAKEVEFALPRELPRTAWLAVAHAMADAYTALGFVADFAIHDDGTQHNPHVHILLTTRVITPEGFGPKIRSADGRQFISEARVTWERIANAALKAAGVTATIDSRSYAKRKLDRQPGQHRGPDREERRARRQRQRERENMAPTYDDRDLPVPDPDGNPIHPSELAAAEGRMLSDLEREEPPVIQEPNGDPAAARQAIERQNSREMSEDDALVYRMEAEDRLGWMDEPISSRDEDVLDRWEDRLSWMEMETSSQPERAQDEPQRDQDRDR